ncbi:MAG: hypothetical protein BMS9Abin26_0237 [Gammaproteobacteria bacterium]|nr:MAG: hypothetical protein BMS9Abin26_0237 [Gammaproteobacteria bacterium]
MTRAIKTFFILIAGIFVFSSHPAVAGFKCWTNNEGVRECGNVVPPEFAQKGHEEISSGGIVTNRVERAKTREELDALAKEKSAERQKLRAAEERQKNDRVLLDTFSNIDEIIMTRDGKINLLNNEIKITRGNIGKLQANLKGLRKNAANNERNGRKVSEKQLDAIKTTKAQIRKYQAFVDKKTREREEMKADYKAKISRFNELTGKTVTPVSGKTASQ